MKHFIALGQPHSVRKECGIEQKRQRKITPKKVDTSFCSNAWITEFENLAKPGKLFLPFIPDFYF